MSMTGGHNGSRDPGWIMKCLRFILRVFGLPFQYIEVEYAPEIAEHCSSFADLLANQTPHKSSESESPTSTSHHDPQITKQIEQLKAEIKDHIQEQGNEDDS